MQIHRTVFALALGLAVTPAIGAFAQETAPAAPAPPATAPATAPPKPSPVTTQTEPGFTVVGLTVRTDNQKEAGGQGSIPALWQRVMQDGSLENIPHRADNNFTVVYTGYTSDATGEYTYMLGVRVSTVDSKLPDGMTSVTVPAGRYALVDSETGSLPDVIPRLWQRIHAMPASELGGQRAFKADYEIYPEGFDWQNAQIAAYIGLKN